MIHRATRRPIRILAVVAFLCQEPACSPATSAEPLPARVTLPPAQLEALAAAAHTASVELPADPSRPIPADTTRLSPTGGPC